MSPDIYWHQLSLGRPTRRHHLHKENPYSDKHKQTKRIHGVHRAYHVVISFPRFHEEDECNPDKLMETYSSIVMHCERNEADSTRGIVP